MYLQSRFVFSIFFLFKVFLKENLLTFVKCVKETDISIQIKSKKKQLFIFQTESQIYI